MALVDCHECGNKVSTESKTCPACGAKVKQKMPLWKKLLFGFIGLLVLANVINGTGKDPKTPATAAAPVQATVAPKAYTASEPFVETFKPAATPTVVGNSWEESTLRDAMTDKEARVFHLKSSESLRLEFPYGGNNMGHLWVRIPDSGEQVAYLELDKGNLICGYRDCHMMVRFDDGKPQRFNASKADDHSSNVLFFNDAKRFIAAARKAKRILVEVQFFQQGSPVIKFEAAEPLK